MGIAPRLQRRNRDAKRSPGHETAGIDLGICNFAAVAYSTEDADLYPGNRLKQDGYYFPKEIATCDDSSGGRATRLHHTWSEGRNHFFHSLAKHIVERCIEHGIGRINVGSLSGVQENENGESKNWANTATSTCTGGVRPLHQHPRIQVKRRGHRSVRARHVEGVLRLR